MMANSSCNDCGNVGGSGDEVMVVERMFQGEYRVGCGRGSSTLMIFAVAYFLSSFYKVKFIVFIFGFHYLIVL